MILRPLKKYALLNKAIASIRDEGFYHTFYKAKLYLNQNKELISFRKSVSDYEQWLSVKTISKPDIKREIEMFSKMPTISIIMPVFNVDVKWLSAAINSVKNQFYPKWELCIVDDGSSNRETIKHLEMICDSRIKLCFSKSNEGIANASNRALKLASGEYIAFLDHDDEITKDALFEIVRAINLRDPDFIYSDEDKIDRNGNRKNPFFKPDWSPDLLRCQNYICHFSVIRKSIIDRIGGFRNGFEGAQDHELFLRISENTKRIYHIPKILYSWREIDTSTAGNPYSKPKAQENALAAEDEHLKRVYGPDCQVTTCDHLFVYDVRCSLKEDILVSIIIPTKDNIFYLESCVESILQESSHVNFEIIIMDNASQEDNSKKWLSGMVKKHTKIRVMEENYPFCWSKLNNRGIEKARGDVFIFLNNDTVVISKDWIERLGGQALREDAGVVGPLLLYGDGTIQHAGVVVGLGGWADHVYKGMQPVHYGSPFVSPMVKRNVLAVTGSCMAISRNTITKIGKFDESFLICGSDVEICIRAHEAGLLNIYDPFVKLYHFESKTRSPQDIPDCDFQMSVKHYKHYRMSGGDPFYNRNLSLNSTTPTLNKIKNRPS